MPTRSGFYEGSAERNETMLDEFAALAKIAVADHTHDENVDFVSLVARVSEPEDDLARKMR
jgi:hypothetical protein